MPGFDGTGPMGQGPMTGGGFGPCGRGLGIRRGRGFRMVRGGGFGRGRGYRFWGANQNYSAESEIEALKREKELIEQEIAALESDK